MWGVTKVSKREEQKQQRRQHIIEIAKDLFLNEGVQHIQMQDIATKAEVGIATLFRYFPKKEYLVIASANAITYDMATYIGEIIVQSIPAYKKVELILDYYIDSSNDSQLRLAKFFESFDLYVKIASESAEQHEQYLLARSMLSNLLLRLAEQGKQDGSLRHDIDLNVFIITMVQNFSSFSFRSRLTKHDTQLATFISSGQQLNIMKDVFLSYIKPQ